jgi:hypothetical protein
VTDTSTSTTAHGRSSATALRLAVVLLLLVGLAVPTTVRRAQRRRRFSRRTDTRLEVENLWRELRATAVDLRMPWPDGRPPRAAARIICHRVNAGPDQVTALEQFVGVLEQARYRERFELDEHTREECQEIVASWLGVLTGAVPPSRARRSRLFPRSVFDARRRTEIDAPVTTQPDPNSFTEVG